MEKVLLECLRRRVEVYKTIFVPDEENLTKEQNIALRVQEYDEEASKFWVEKALGLGEFEHPYLDNDKSVEYGRTIVDLPKTSYFQKMVLIMEHPLVETAHIDWVGY